MAQIIRLTGIFLTWGKNRLSLCITTVLMTLNREHHFTFSFFFFFFFKFFSITHQGPRCQGMCTASYIFQDMLATCVISLILCPTLGPLAARVLFVVWPWIILEQALPRCCGLVIIVLDIFLRGKRRNFLVTAFCCSRRMHCTASLLSTDTLSEVNLL